MTKENEMSDEIPREPTTDEASAHARIGDGWAGWYPQMGGYTSVCVAVPSDGCWDVYVWHDGEFPFTGPDVWGESRGPHVVHHCEPSQFVTFGQWLDGLDAEVAPSSGE